MITTFSIESVKLLIIKSNNPSSGKKIHELKSSQYFWKKLTSPKRKIKKIFAEKIED